MLVGMCLPKFDIYQGTVAPKCFKILIFFQKKKKVLFDVRSEIHLVQRIIVKMQNICNLIG